MEHRKKGRKLGRTASHRKALLSNLSISLILNKRIKTTEAKAKELRKYIEPLVTKAKKALSYKDSEPEKNVHLRREARKFLNNKEALNVLFDEIGSKVGDRPGGYTRVLKTGTRFGDGASTAIIEFVDYNFVKEKEKEIKPGAKDEKGAEEKGTEGKESNGKTKKTVKKKEKEQTAESKDKKTVRKRSPRKKKEES